MTTSYTTGVLRKRATSLLAGLLLGFSGSALAHEGHHHDDAEAPAAAATPQPASTPPRLEVVARREGGDIVLYVDDYASNAPLDGLQLSVRSGGLTVQAAGGEGRYRIPADLLPAPGEQTLELSVHGSGVEAQLQVPLSAAVVPEAAPAPAGASSLWSRLSGAVLIVGLLFAAWLLRRRRGPQAGQEARTA